MSRRFDPHSHLDSFLPQLTVKPFGFSIAVHQPLLATFPNLRVCPGDLLYAWVIITTYNEHLPGGAVARTGLRMMPTFPPLPLSFRTADFFRYGWKAGVSGSAFPRVA